MTNYDKKRKRQNGRQDSKASHRFQLKQKEYFEKVSKTIDKLIADGVFPSVDFDISTMQDSRNE